MDGQWTAKVFSTASGLSMNKLSFSKIIPERSWLCGNCTLVMVALSIYIRWLSYGTQLKYNLAQVFAVNSNLKLIISMNFQMGLLKDIPPYIAGNNTVNSWLHKFNLYQELRMLHMLPYLLYCWVKCESNADNS